jgi:hypothetical protein
VADNYYKLYIAANLELASSIIIKSEDTITGLNQYVNDQAMINGTPQVDMSNPLTWKYYLNISGQYHPLDKIITITSLDTQKVINFTVESLLLHPATAKAYAFGTKYYQMLIDTYPTEQLLIKGVLYPVDINKAIAAKDGKILNYPPGLIEPNEYSLVSKLQTWLYAYKIRWTNVQFGLSDILYPATALGIMYLNLLPALLTFRLEACKTNEAHSFHVRQYLASHNLLNQYIDNMTLSQTLFFYRNIAYIERNSGKQATFDWLVYNLLTVRNLPLVKYELHHDLSSQPSSLYPNLLFYKNSLNKKIGLSVDVANTATLQQVLDNEVPLALDNLKYQGDYYTSAKSTMENSVSNVLFTKTLESAVVDETNTGPYSLNEILLNEWLHLAFNGNYTAYVEVVNPKTGDTLLLTALDAFTFSWYVYLLSIDINPVVIPKPLAIRVQRVFPITTIGGSSLVPIDDLMSVVDPKIVPRTTAIEALSLQPEITEITSTLAFYNLCTEIYNAAQFQRNLAAHQGLSVQRAMVFNMSSRIYGDVFCELAPATQTFDQWLNERNIDIVGLNTTELNTLYTKILNNATGANLFVSKSLKDIQSSMLSIMTQLSSYSVQFIPTINGTNEIKMDFTAVRGDDITNSQSTFSLVDMSTDPMTMGTGNKVKFDYPLDNGNLIQNAVSNSASLIQDITSKSEFGLQMQLTTVLDLRISAGYDSTVVSVTGDTTSTTLVDVYGFNNNPNVTTSGATSQNMAVNEILITGVTITGAPSPTTTPIDIGGFPTGFNITK